MACVTQSGGVSLRVFGSVTNSSGFAPCLEARLSSQEIASSCSCAEVPRLSKAAAGAIGRVGVENSPGCGSGADWGSSSSGSSQLGRSESAETAGTLAALVSPKSFNQSGTSEEEAGSCSCSCSWLGWGVDGAAGAASAAAASPNPRPLSHSGRFSSAWAAISGLASSSGAMAFNQSGMSAGASSSSLAVSSKETGCSAAPSVFFQPASRMKSGISSSLAGAAGEVSMEGVLAAGAGAGVGAGVE